MKKLWALAATLALLIGAMSAPAVRAQSDSTEQSGSCDRACLQSLVDQYLAALVKHDPTGLPLAKDVKFTENTATIPLGDGLWVGASEAPTTFKIYAADPVSHQIAFYGMMKEFNKPIIFVLRLKVEGGKITEIEHIVVRDVRPAGLPNLVTPRPGLVETIPPDARVSRDEMFKIANSYFDSIEQSNGDVAPYADDCVRHENGMQTTTNKTPANGPLGAANSPMAKISQLGCAASMDTHGLMYITKIWPRRVLVLDEERGLAFSFPMFVHRGNVRSIKISGVPGVDTVPMNFGPIDLQAAEIFGIRDGKIHDIEAMGYLLPYNAKTGWE
ncbi:MAG: hypothetical protein WA369_15885 [Candidatus Acidiferrales bacterium]